MPVQFSSAEVQRLRQAQPVLASSVQAKDRLQSMAAQLVDSRGGVKMGFLKLVNDKQGNLQLGTRWSRSADASTQQATDMVKSLVAQAYGDNPAVMQALDSYLHESGQRLGTHSFVKLVKTLEQSSGQAGPAALAGARIKTRARLDEGAVDVGIKVARDLEHLQSLQRQLPGAATPQARALVRTQMRQAMDSAQASMDKAPALRERLETLAPQLHPQILPAVPGLGADALQGSVQLHSLLEQAVSAGPVSAADRQAVLSQLNGEQRQQLMDYFDSTAMDRDLAALALHQAQAPGSGAGAALQELRDCDTALRRMNGVAPPAPAAAQSVPANVLAPVQASFGQWLEAMNSGRSHEGLSRLETLMEQMNDASVNLAQAQQYKIKGAEEVQHIRDQIMMALISGLSDTEAAQALQLLRQSDVVGQLALGSDVLGKAGFEGLASQYRDASGPMERLNERISAMEGWTAMFEMTLSIRLRGHRTMDAPFAQALPPRQPLAQLSPEIKSNAWRAFAAEPALSLAEFHATLGRSKTRPADAAAVPQWQADKVRSQRIKDTLGRLQPLTGMDSARVVQLFMHPASRDPKVGDHFIYLLATKAPALLELSRQLGRMPTDAQIWQAVLGEPVPADIQGLGSPELGARLVQEARQRYTEAVRAEHLAAGGDEESLAARLTNDPLMLGLIQGFSLERQIELIQHPDRPLTGQDFFASSLRLEVKNDTASTVFGQTVDIHRWTQPTRFIFETAGAPPSVLDPNAQPWQALTPPPDHPVIQDLSGRVQALTAGRAAQTQAVLSALTQASTSVLRFVASACPTPLATGNAEHGAYDFRLSAQADGTVQICITSNAPMEFDGELRLEVSPQGDIRTAGLRLLPRATLAERWPQVRDQLQEMQDALNDPSQANLDSVIAQTGVLTHQLERDLAILRTQAQALPPASQGLPDEAAEALADAQFDLANALLDRNRLHPDPLAEQDVPDAQELDQARQLLEAVMAHARGVGNEALLDRSRELHDEMFGFPEVRLEQIDAQDFERGSMASMIRERAQVKAQASVFGSQALDANAKQE